MLRNLFILIFTSLFLMLGCEKEPYNYRELVIEAEYPKTVSLSDTINGKKDTLKFNIFTEKRKGLINVSLFHEENLLSLIDYKEGVFQTNINYLFRPNKTGRYNMNLRIINRYSFNEKFNDTTDYNFKIEVIE